jgi:prepilin-type N-terminal cleavage/methylation domain-containing protein
VTTVRHIPGQAGFTLLELTIALLLSAVVLLAVVQLVSSAGAATSLQDNQATLHDRLRYAERLLGRAISEAGYAPQPWNPAFSVSAVTAETADAVTTRGDRLAVRGWSDRNCFDNLNPDRDAAGNARFYLRENRFDLNSSGQLARQCRFGPSADELVTQVRRQGLVPGVEAFQLLFGLDEDGDGSIERWARPGEWADERSILAVRAGLLLAAPGSVAGAEAAAFTILGAPVRTPADGRLREALEITRTLRSRVE